MNPVIPAPVPIPLPAPPWLIQLLQVFTFIIHLVFMNLLVGGTVILAVSMYLGRTDSRHRELGRRAARALPPVVAFTITAGVAPLLFLQLLYGQLFYTSSALMAWPWLAVILLLMLAYYGVYWFNLQQDELGSRSLWVMLLIAVLFLHVMKTFVQNMTFLERPLEFYPRFLATPVGNYLGPYDGFVFARFSHFFLAALSVAGLGLALLSRNWREESPDLAVWTRRYALIWFQAATGLQFFSGLWFLFSQPERIRLDLLGRDGLSTGLLVAAITFAVLALIAARRSLIASAIAISGTIAMMAVIRHLVRLEHLRPYFDPHTLPVQGQWVVFSLFLLLLVAGLATVLWMLSQLFRSADSVTRTG